MGDQLWRHATGAFALGATAYLLAPGAVFREAIWLLILVVTCVSIVVGVRRHRPARTRPWNILLVAFGMLTMSYVLRFPTWVSSASEMAGNLALILSYPLIAVAVLHLVRLQAPGGDREGAIDGTIVMIAMATLLAGTVFDTNQLGADADLLPRLHLIVAPLLLSAVSAATFRLLFVGSARVPAAWMLVAAAVGALIGNVLRTVLVTQGAYERGMWTDLFLLLSYVGVGVAALHPSIVRLTEPTEPGNRRLTFARLAVLGASLAAAPLTLVVQEPGVGISMPVISSIALSLLVLWRLARLVVEREMVRQALHQRAERQEALAAIGLLALDDIDLEQLSDDVTRTCQDLLGLHTCDVVPVATPVSAGNVAVPVGSGGGVLVAGRDEPWSDEDTAFLQAVANVLAGAIERFESQESMRHQAVHDALTGLPNRVLIIDRIDQALARMRRGGGTVAVLFIDLDGFKRVNDEHGHRAGDELLVEVTARLRRAVRDADTLGRLAGDEFVVVCDAADQSTAEQVAARVVGEITAPFELSCGIVRIGASVGVALSDPSATDPERLLNDADVAMYLAKGQNQSYVTFDEVVGATRARRRRLERDLAGAAGRGELHLLYQPLFSSDGDDDHPGRVVGAEALLRWDHPDLGSVSPAEFIPIADATGIILPLGDWVVAQAVDQLARWCAGLPDDVPFTVWVNLSSRQLSDVALPARVAATLRAARVAPDRFGLEVTETAIVGDDALPILDALDEVGVKLALDDFGTGFSSLTHLKRIALDLIKIDRSFVDGVTEAGEDRVIVRAVTAIARELGVAVLGEGVENAAQLDALRAVGCTLAQGYLLGRPTPADEMPPPGTAATPAAADLAQA